MTTPEPYIIAEVGANHLGDLELAQEYVKVFSAKGASAIKFQKRDMATLFDAPSLARPYENDHSFGDTYGEHREALEFSIDQYRVLKSCCEQHGVDFMVTPFDEVSLTQMLEVGVDRIKVASFDAGNLPFLEQIFGSGVPVVMSTGGAGWDAIDASVALAKSMGSDLTVLHCVSQYPCPFESLNLGKIKALKERYPGTVVGLSDHFSGTLSGPLGYMAGAEVFEKHVTLNRAWKGTDQPFSLEPHGFGSFVRDIHRAKSQMMELSDESSLGTEPVFAKLGKSVTAARDLSAGEVLTSRDLRGRITRELGVPVREIASMLGKRVLADVPRDGLVRWEHLEGQS